MRVRFVPGPTGLAILLLALAFGPSAAAQGSAACSPALLAAREDTPEMAVPFGDDLVVLRGGGLLVLDGETLATIGEVLLHGPTDLALLGDVAVVSSRGIGLEVVDLGIPARPKVIGTFAKERGYEEVEATGRWAFAASGWNVDLFDLADPARPLRVESRGEGRWNLKLLGHLLVSLDQDGPVLLEDVSDPRSPVVLSRFGGGWPSVAAAGQLLVVAGGGGVEIVDITDPRRPRELSRVSGGFWGTIAFDGRVAVLRDSSARPLLLDLVDPDQPVLSPLPAGAPLLAWRKGILLGGPTVRLDPSACLASAGDPPIAAFDPVPARPAIGEPVEFVDRSSGGPARWRWDFGDGTRSTERSPRHLFRTPGRHVVTLVVTNESGTSRRSLAVEVAPQAPPRELDFDWSPPFPAAGETVTLTARTSHSTGVWLWTLPDGRTLEGRSIEVSWPTGGAQQVELFGQWAGSQGTVARSVPVRWPQAPRMTLRGSFGLPSGFTVRPGAGGSDGFLYLPMATYNSTDRRLLVLDAGSGRPSIVGRLDGRVSYQGCVLEPSRGRLVLVDGWGAQLFDVADPARPRYLGTFVADDEIAETTMRGDLLVVATRNGEIEAVDISDPARPRRLGTWPDSASWQALAQEGRWLYALGNARLELFDLEHPQLPFPVASVPLADRYLGFLVDSGRLHLLGMSTMTVDAADPFHPLTAPPTSPPRLQESGFGAGELAWVFWHDDVNVEGAMVYRRESEFDGGTPLLVENWPGTRELLPVDDGLAVVTATAVWVFSVTPAPPDEAPAPAVAEFVVSPASPVVGEEVVLLDRTLGTESRRWTVDGVELPSDAVVGHRFTTTGPHLVTLAVSGIGGSSTASQVVSVGPRPEPPSSPDFEYSPSDRPLAGEPIRFVDRSVGDELQRVWEFDGPWNRVFEDSPDHSFPLMGTHEVTLRVRNAAGVADVTKSLLLHHPTAACEPTLVRRQGDIRWADFLHLDGDKAFVGWYDWTISGLQILDVADPDHPLLDGDIQVNGMVFTQDIATIGDIAYWANSRETAILETPGWIARIGTFPVRASRMVVTGDRLVTLGSGLQLFDVSDPKQPTVLDTWSRPPNNRATYGIAAQGSLVALAQWEGVGLMRIEGNRLVPAGFLEIPDLPYPEGIAMSGALVVVATWNGLVIVDVSDPAAPREISRSRLGYPNLPEDNSAFNIDQLRFEGDLLVVTDRFSGITTLDLSDPTNPVCLEASPQEIALGAAHVHDRLLAVTNNGVDTMRGCDESADATSR